MDSTGVPHKINRHVYKAVNHLGVDGSSFLNIYQYVRVCTRNLKPVPHLKQTVKRSLNNLEASGIVRMDNKQRYKLKTKFPSLNNKLGEVSCSNENLSPQKRKNKHQMDSGDEDDNGEIENVPKRFKASTKNISRTRVQVKKLPKHRQYDLSYRPSRSSNKIAEPTNKTNVIYKKINNNNNNSKSDDGEINHEPGSNDKDFINNECERRQSKEATCYDTKPEEDTKTEKIKSNNDVTNNNNDDSRDVDSITSKNATSYQLNEFEDANHETLDEPISDIVESTTVNNIEHEHQDDESAALGTIRRYNYNYLN